MSSPSASPPADEPDLEALDKHYMQMARSSAEVARFWASPNPAVGAVLLTKEGALFIGRTGSPGEAHAEIMALEAAGAGAEGSTLYVTLEPCSHEGRTPPCVEAILAAGVARVVVGIHDPDPRVKGEGASALRRGGVATSVGVCASEVAEDLAAYLTHRRLGRPYVLLKLAVTLDGRIAAADGSSRWITGASSRADVHRLRALSDAVLVGAGTVRSDNPSLTVRDFKPPISIPLEDVQPLRVVLGTAPADARVQPALEVSGDLREILADLARRGVLQLLVEGGAQVAGEFHRSGLVDRYVFYVAPTLAGGAKGTPPLGGAGPVNINEFWHGQFVETTRLGDDLRITLRPPESKKTTNLKAC